MASAAGYNLLHHIYTNISAGICICICICIRICIDISLGDDDGTKPTQHEVIRWLGSRPFQNNPNLEITIELC